MLRLPVSVVSWLEGSFILFLLCVVIDPSTVHASESQLRAGDLYEVNSLQGKGENDLMDQKLMDFAKRYAQTLIDEIAIEAELSKARDRDIEKQTRKDVDVYVKDAAKTVTEEFFRGRYDRSRARLPENIDAWRSKPDIGNPGADLANFPNSAFTLPQGRAYIEMSPLTYYGPARGQGPQFNSEFLLRYGVTDNIEARIFGNGVSWQGTAYNVSGYNPSATGFSPIAFDTKIHLMEEMKDFYLPTVGFEAFIQTQLLGTAAFNQGTTPGFTFNFDQSLPFDIDFEYNLGAIEQVDVVGNKVWQFSFQWAFQRDVLEKNVALFIHGFYNAMTLPRLPTLGVAYNNYGLTPSENAVGAGVIWTPNNRVSFWAQSAGGTTAYTPSVISNIGFAVAF